MSAAEVGWSHPDDEPALFIAQSVQGGPEQLIVVLPDEVPALLDDIRRTYREHHGEG